MKRIVALGLIALVSVGCGKNSDNKKSDPRKSFTVNGLTSNKGWCSAENLLDNLQVVTRVNFLDNENLQMERILIDSHAAPVAHRFSKTIKYALEPGYGGWDSFVVETVEGKSAVSDLKDHYSQGSIVEKIFSKNQNLVSVGNFAPEKAIILKASGLLEDSKQELFPCENFSSSFDLITKVRPMIEFQIKVGQIVSSFVRDSLLPIKMAIQTPIYEVKIEYAKLEGTQWCNWFEMKSSSPHITILTLKSDSFKLNTYTGAFDLYAEYPSILLDNAERAKVYRIDQAEGVLKGSYEWTPGHRSTDTFVQIQDASGVNVLVKTHSESNLLTSLNLFYECSDKRPLESYPAYKAGLGKLLELEKTL